MRYMKFMLIMCTLAVFFCSCSITNHKDNEEARIGILNGTNYKNSYFDFSIETISDWCVLGDKLKEVLTDKGLKQVASNNESIEKQLSLSEKENINLLFVYKYNPIEYTEFNPKLMCIATDLKNYQSIKSSKDYLEAQKKTINLLNLNYTYEKDIYSEKIGKKDFDVLEYIVKSDYYTYTQRHYCIVIKGYALSFITSYSNQQEKKQILDMINSLEFS